VNTRHRLFFALVPDAGVRRQVAEIQARLDVGGRAVSPSNLHVTLAFLGMQEAAVIPQVRAVAEGQAFEPCRVVLDRLGQFGQGSVLWLGASDIPAALQAFQHSLATALTAAGIGHDPKPWQLHLTLYRRLRKPVPILDSGLDPVAIEWDLSGFELIESVGAKNGVVYHSIGHWQAGCQGDRGGSA
jgi:2'-5' RNA ligase